MSKTTVVIGASDNPERYGYKATHSLLQHGHKVYPIGIKPGKIDGLDIITDKPRAIIYVNGVDLLQKYTFEKSDCFFEYLVPFSGKSVITLGFMAYPERIPFNGNSVPDWAGF